MGRVSIVERLLETGVYPAVPSQGMELRRPGHVRAFLYGWPKTPLEVFITSLIVIATHAILYTFLLNYAPLLYNVMEFDKI